MINAMAYRIIGTLADGSVGIRLFSNNRRRAQSLADFLERENADWTVRIEEFSPEALDAEGSVRLARTSAQIDELRPTMRLSAFLSQF